MAFRWFRKNKNTTRWLYILVTIFVMVTFTVTGAMLTGLKDDSNEVLAGSFVTPLGEKIDITAVEFRQLSYQLSRLQYGRNITEKDVWRMVMMDARAVEAGIVVSDEMLKAYIRQALPFRTQQEFEQFLASVGLSGADFNTLIRQQVRVMLYTNVNRDDPRVLSEMVFEQFQEDNELFRLEFVAFADEAEASQLDGSSVSEEELKKFYEEDLDRFRKDKEFSSKEKFAVEAAVLAMDQVEVDALKQFLPTERQELTDEEIKRFYDGNIHRFEMTEEESAGGDDDAEDGGEEPAGDEPAGDEATGDEPVTDEPSDEHAVGDEHKHRPLEEVRDLIEKELLLGRVINEAMTNYREMKEARDKAATEEEKKLEEEKKAAAAKPADTAEGEASEGEAAQAEGADKPAEKVKEDLFAIIAEKYGMERVDFGEPMVLEEIKNLERIGSELLPNLVRYLPEGNVIPRPPTAETPYGFLLRLNKKLPAEHIPFEEVKDRLPELWVEFTASERAKEKADGFDEALAAAARAPVEDEVVALEAEVAVLEKEVAEKAGAEKVEDAADTEMEETAEDRLEEKKAELEDLISSKKGGFFAQVAQDQGVEVKTVDWYRKTYPRTQLFQDEEKTPEHTLMGQTELFYMDEGHEVAGPFRDDEHKLYLVARIAGRKKPELSEMKLKDRQDAEMAVMRMLNPALMFAQFSSQMMPDLRFEYDALAGEMQLALSQSEVPEKKDKEEAPTPEE